MTKSTNRGKVSAFGIAAVVVAACAADVQPPGSGGTPQLISATHPDGKGRHGRDGSGTPSADRTPTTTDASEGDPTGHPKPATCSDRLDPGWLAMENDRQGTTSWTDARRTRAGSINGYLSQASAVCGDTVTAYLTSTAAVHDATVTAYRMGWYYGSGARQVWRTENVTVAPQAPLTPSGPGLLLEAAWKPTLSIKITPAWTPGYYLLVVRAKGQTASSIPLVIRADGDRSPLEFQASVLTYQAYNTYGGLSAYAKSATDPTASRLLSFDRPYDDGGYYSPYQYELPLIREIEKLGLDTDYVTDIDVDRDPAQLLTHKGLVTGGHSEYWTRAMYDGVVAARDHGVNVAFFGANAVYTAARLDPSPSGPDHRVVIWRGVAGDPPAVADPARATVNWAKAPLNRPEASLVGQGYGYLYASGGLRVLHPDSWIFAGTGVTLGQVLPDTVGGEYDQVFPDHDGTPKDIDVLAAMPMRIGKTGAAAMATTTYYVAMSQAGIFDAGTTYWPCVITGDCLHLPDTLSSREVVMQMTDNILTAFAAGPAGLAHPSTPNPPPTPDGLVASAAQPGDVAVRTY